MQFGNTGSYQPKLFRRRRISFCVAKVISSVFRLKSSGFRLISSLKA
ncbi:hypothetical protein DDT91_05485 [Algoriphagus sp. AK58]|nr:hypothetical protein [Algoriphagus sp. AK58]